eukprot:Platyproteum_vivax@DN14752_c0_g1_i1.p1
MDPIAAHVQRRTERRSSLMRAHLETLLTSPQTNVQINQLRGASVSINHTFQRTPRATLYAYYELMSDHDPKDTHERLNNLAPIFRYQLAQKLQLGHTPAIRFVSNQSSKLFDKRRLFRLAREMSWESAVQASKRWEQDTDPLPPPRRQ